MFGLVALVTLLTLYSARPFGSVVTVEEACETR